MNAANCSAKELEFKFVVPRKGKRRPKSRGKLQTSFNRPEAYTVDRIAVCHSTVIKQLQAAEQDLLQSAFFTECVNNLNPLLADVEQIICLGLGNFSECSIARYQLAFIRCLRDKVIVGTKGQFYDPVFSSSEVDLLRTLAEEVLEENVEGKYRAEHKTLFYLPHCPKQIVNNVLWKNWHPTLLTNVILLCNSFGTITHSQPSRLLENSAGYILRATGAFREVPLRNCFRFTDIFNDTSLHFLDSSEKLEKSAWESIEEPSYEADDLELITKEFAESIVLS